MHTDRRQFLAATGTAFAGLLVTGCTLSPRVAGAGLPAGERFGALVPDPAGVLDLPQGFSYRVISRLGDAMSDGFTVPDNADGMGCFDIGNGELALVRNHELVPQSDGGGVAGRAYDTVARSLVPLPGGTTTIVLDKATLERKREYRSLAGTIRNCAGGITPWGSWLTCEENTARGDGRINRDHGYVFEVPADAGGLVDPLPLTAMGRFNHEAACVDPATGVVYMTEDRPDSLLYRYLPTYPGRLERGGTLQALVLEGIRDTRNIGTALLAVGQPVRGTWITLDNPEAPEDDLRTRGAAMGAAVFARGEGIWMGDGEMYFTATSGGAAQQGQIFRLKPNIHEGDVLDLFYESPALSEYSFGDNLCITPFGDLMVCEDQYGDAIDNHLRGVTPTGEAYAFGHVRVQSETAGACFSPDGRTMFLNVYSPAMTLAITGPWPQT
ncbi:alkaline phosphatase PhoX [Aurantiacibacter luteus]|uniref:Phosphatase n=1 Tax=Aurantiacibacter luteus TaxID=1581420 RepID=A0A0G9MVI4_9SPHN|nr:alkaline phosphatase PhoX [Aurantiacibacter luteus]KLE34716.1 phosphatase [Aurantiacibacter luteus]